MTHGREVLYDIEDPDLPEISKWLSANPNRINLGRIGLRYKGDTLTTITDTFQELDIWNGVITSTFTVDGSHVKVVTQGDFDSDAVAFDIESNLIASGDLQVEFDFPFPPIHKVVKSSDYEIFMGTYEFPQNHTTSEARGKLDFGTTHIYHKMQETSYFLNLRWPLWSPLSLTRCHPAGSNEIDAHRYVLSPTQHIKKALRGKKISFTAQFSPDKQTPSLPWVIQKRNSLGWHKYWLEGGFIDVTESSNPKAIELQRRIILSQYAMRVNSAATGQPPQESGLVYNGWWGKFHLEMVTWHCAHWVTLGRKKYFDKIFPAVYEMLLPSAEERASRMGWEGARYELPLQVQVVTEQEANRELQRWPKMTEPIDKGISPGETRAYLSWQQPQPMYLASLAYKAAPTKETLKRWDRVLTSTADYMASFAWFNNATGHYDLGPPIQGVTENSSPTEISNLAYELAFWAWGLDAACAWKEKLGEECPKKWKTVAENLAPPPQLDGLFAPWVGGGMNSSWWEDPELNEDPRSVIMLQGILPDTPVVRSRPASLIALLGNPLL